MDAAATGARPEGAGRAAYALAVAVVLVCTALLVFAEGNVAVAVAPIFVVLAAIGVWRLPIRIVAHAVLFISLLLDNPTERPGRGLYKSPLYAPGSFFYKPLAVSLHVPGLKVTGLEFLIILLALIVGVRLLTRSLADGEVRPMAAAPLLRACLVAMGTLLAMEVYGLGRGGSFPHSLLQMRTMFFTPFMALFFAYAFKSMRDVKALLNTLIIVGMLRAFLCIYYYLTFMRFQGGGAGDESGDGSYVTTHSDSILASVVLVMCIVNIYQHPTARSMVMAALVMPVVGLGVVFNNRRIAFVAVAMGFFFSYLAAGTAFRRRVHLTGLAALPLILLYVGAGWNAHGGWAKPVQSLKSVVQQKDTSSATRDIENYNLLQTFQPHWLLGSGFGHQYNEIVKAFDISAIFEAYRYVPHNSILWFWGAGGFLGMTLYWMFMPVGVFIAARLCRFAVHNRQVVMAMVAITAVISYGSQCFGDMGLMSWMGALIVASTLGVCAAQATQVGAWTNGAVSEVPAPPEGVRGIVAEPAAGQLPGSP